MHFLVWSLKGLQVRVAVVIAPMTTIGLPENGLLAAVFAQARLRILIVSPEETSVLSDRPRPSLTLASTLFAMLTCATLFTHR